MAQPIPLLEPGALGMTRDLGRDQLPPGVMWNLVDYLPAHDAPFEKRGGWSYLTTSALGAGSYVAGGAYAPFSAGHKHCVINDAGTLYTVAGGTPSSVGTFLVPQFSLAFYREKLIVCGDGTAVPKTYDGSAIANLGGSPPNAKFSVAHKDRLVLAGSTSVPQRVYFSAPANSASWDTTNGYWDFTFPVTGLVSLRNALVVFSAGLVERLIGSTPPPGTDMSRGPLGAPGCIDGRSIVLFDDQAVFVNPTGVYMTDGATIADITDLCGADRYWRDTLSAWTSSWTLAAGRLRDWYVISIMNGSTFVDCLAFDIHRRRFFRLANVKATFMWSSAGSAAPETYFGLRSAARAGSLGSIFSPAAGVKNDADGTAVTPVIETGWRLLGQSKARVRDIYIWYDVRDAATDNPLLTVGYLDSPEETSYTQLRDLAGASKTFAETSEITKARGSVRKLCHGIALRVTQTNASATSKLYRLAFTGHGREGSRL